MDKVVKLKRFRRTFEGTSVSEERYLDLQAETYRLKKELQDKDQQHKLLVVKLRRTQEESKKNLRAGVEQSLQTSRDKNTVMAMLLHQSNAEEKIHELELKLQEGHKDAQKYLEFKRQSKAEVDSLKKRLEVSVRASRRTCAPTPVDISKRYEKEELKQRTEPQVPCKRQDYLSVIEQTLEKFRRSTAMNRHMFSKLKNRITTLQDENKELHTLLRDRPDDVSQDPTSARLEVVSQVVGPADSLTKKVAGRHKQQDNLNNRVDETGDIGCCGRRSAFETPPNANGCQVQEQTGVQPVQDSQGSLQVTVQLMKACEDLDKLKKKHDRTTEELQQLKINHSKCLQKLQDTYSELTQERKVRQELEIEKKHTSGELVALQHLKSNLQQLRHQNVRLENENAELLNAALNVPRTNFAEIKGLREQLVEELKQRNLAVANAAKLTTQLEDCKRDLARLAVVEANWQYLKIELEVANNSVATGDLKVAELQAENKLLQKQVKELQIRQAEIPEELDVTYES